MDDSKEAINQYDAFIQLSNDGDSVEIVKKIAMEKMFMRSANEQLILMEKARQKNKRIQGQKKEDFEPPYMENEIELNQKVEDGLISLSTSQSSFKFSDVT